LLLNGGVGASATALLTIRSHRTATRGDTGSFPPATSVSSAAKALNAQAPERCPDKAKAPISPPSARRHTPAALLDQAFARACQIGDPCWEGTAARGLALVAEARGDIDRAYAMLSDARTRANRLADPYVWLDGYILDAQCDIGRRHGHPDTKVWVESMRLLASRCGMRELAVRAMVHSGALGNAGDAQAAAILATDIDSEPVAQLTT
jgi:hypothetical protein